MNFYLACALALVSGLLIGMATRLWNKPAKRPAIVVGMWVRLKCDVFGRYTARSVIREFRVIAECECPGNDPAYLLQQVENDREVGCPMWRKAQAIEPIPGRGKGLPAPTEEQARALNAAYGITCDTHPLEDCTFKGRQRLQRGLPGHQT